MDISHQSSGDRYSERNTTRHVTDIIGHPPNYDAG